MFERLGNAGAFGAFVMLGDPGLETSAIILDALVEGGADMIEVGIPFSDPIADGPVIQAAADRALMQGMAPGDCFQMLARFRERHNDIPVGILTYANIVLARGRDAFYHAALQAGVDSVLVADVPAFEAEPFVKAAQDASVAPVLIAAPNTPDETLRHIAGLGQGYTYCVARAGVTGDGQEMQLDHMALFDKLKGFGAPPPVLGFGISRPEHVRSALEEGAAGVISGSAIVRLIAEHKQNAPSYVRDFVAGMKAA
jgi:tryptophan synthase alpha chain